MAIPRTDSSVFGRWWWTVDRWTLFSLIALSLIGVMLSLSASPPVAERLGLDSLHFVNRHVQHLIVAITVMLVVSFLAPREIRRFAVVVLMISVALLAMTLFFGVEIKGAQRWLEIGGVSIQPLEFVKPSLAITAAWVLAAERQGEEIPGRLIGSLLCAIVISLLLFQPDFGQALLVGAIWFGQWFLAGLGLVWAGAIIAVAFASLLAAYFIFPHVANRFDAFLDPAISYQVSRSMEAFRNGGFWGRGPGEGTAKMYLPDAHADFVFAVAGEEFGFILCFLIVSLFAFIVIRGIVILLRRDDLFTIIAAAGLLMQFAFQALINMGSTTSLLPTKGMTLPMISYGGSSLLALAIGMGMFLGLTRRQPRGL